ncbi:hypothetical protein BJV74DRAFT_854920 [Russula compacta]|nr:hypothetical protein BJV74DRAFT_854920 [Russula compacta]
MSSVATVPASHFCPSIIIALAWLMAHLHASSPSPPSSLPSLEPTPSAAVSSMRAVEPLPHFCKSAMSCPPSSPQLSGDGPPPTLTHTQATLPRARPPHEACSSQMERTPETTSRLSRSISSVTATLRRACRESVNVVWMCTDQGSSGCDENTRSYPFFICF